MGEVRWLLWSIRVPERRFPLQMMNQLDTTGNCECSPRHALYPVSLYLLITHFAVCILFIDRTNARLEEIAIGSRL